MPTREDVLAIRAIEEAFDLSTRRVTKRELALIRIASRGDLLEFTEHAAAEADDEPVPHAAVWKVIERTKRTSKDLEPTAQRQVGINFDGTIPDRRRNRAKGFVGRRLPHSYRTHDRYGRISTVAAPREIISFCKTIAPGVSVRIDGVPASVHGADKVHAFDRKTAYRVEHFLLAARERMANGETDIRFQFNENA